MLVFIICWASQIVKSTQLKKEQETLKDLEIEEASASFKASQDHYNPSKDKSLGCESFSLESEVSKFEVLPVNKLAK